MYGNDLSISQSAIWMPDSFYGDRQNSTFGHPTPCRPVRRAAFFISAEVLWAAQAISSP
jgi:hypothetical protein